MTISESVLNYRIKMVSKLYRTILCHNCIKYWQLIFSD